MISIGAAVEYCACGEELSGDDGARSGVSIRIIGEALRFFYSLLVWGVLWLVSVAMYCVNKKNQNRSDKVQ